MLLLWSDHHDSNARFTSFVQIFVTVCNIIQSISILDLIPSVNLQKPVISQTNKGTGYDNTMKENYCLWGFYKNHGQF